MRISMRVSVELQVGSSHIRVTSVSSSKIFLLLESDQWVTVEIAPYISSTIMPINGANTAEGCERCLQSLYWSRGR